MVEGDARCTQVLAGIAKPVRVVAAVDVVETPSVGVLVSSGCLDLPPPTLVA